MTRLLLILAALALLCMPALAHDDDPPTACADHTLAVGFYAFFEPVSYNASDDPDSDDFHTHLGYEADLLSAMEALDSAGLSFTRSAIATWAGIWLRSASEDFDIVSGGITSLDTRRYDDEGVEQIAFTRSHMTFRHSLLTRADDAERLDSYAALTSDVRVGVVPSTTGESRLLEITGLTDADGVLIAGATVETPAGALTADGSGDYVITAADESPGLEGRTRLLPPDETMPQVVYLGAELGEAVLIEALENGDIDAIARGQIGNGLVAAQSDGELVISALDDAVEYGGLSTDVDAVELRECLDDKINWLTDGGALDYADWLDDPEVFMARAKLWNESQGE